LYISDKRNIIGVLEGRNMDYITTKEAASKWGITDRMVLYHCTSGRIEGAIKMGNTWLIPKDTVKPEDKRYRRKYRAK
jgi:excisionase family DNA binding protein